jgi:hypothetical protein
MAVWGSLMMSGCGNFQAKSPSDLRAAGGGAAMISSFM